jgi:TP901 family phage tail tape measure protein
MAIKVPVVLNPVDASKVEASLARIQSKAKGIDFGGGARSIEKLSRPLGKITGQATEFQKSLEASNARVIAFGASVAVINKLSQAFQSLVANTVKVEATFAKINTILGGTDKQLRQFGDGIFKVAQQTGTSFDQVSEGALELARQGLSVEESLSRVATALKLVRVAGIDSQKAVSGLTAAIKGFAGSGLTVAQIADKLSEVDTKFATSTEALIEGLQRSSSSARAAGVSFDELLAIITTVEERTQRGGAVIGNAFKTIFTRIGRSDVLRDLKELKIEVTDLEGNIRPATQLLTELARKVEELGGVRNPAAKGILEKVAGARQIENLLVLFEDLNSETSIFATSMNVAANSMGALDAKNEKLNQTLEALINKLAVGSQKLASLLGEIGFEDAARDILKVFNNVVDGINDLLQGDSMGGKFARGLVKGIGNVLSGPGLAIVGAVFTKLFVDLAKFGAGSLKSLLGLNAASQQQAALQQSVLQTLLQNEDIQAQILKHQGNKVVQEQILLKIYNDQINALARVQKAAAVVTPGLYGKGMRGGEGGVIRTSRGASGYLAERRDVKMGVGGASPSSKVVSIPNFAFGGGQYGTMIANTSEYYVPNYAGGGDAIFNQNMINSMGLPSGAQKIRAAGGYVPNFASGAKMSADFKTMGKSQYVDTYGQLAYNTRARAGATGMTASARQTQANKLKSERAKRSGLINNIGNYAMIVPQRIGPPQPITGTRGGKKVGFMLVGYKGTDAVAANVANDEQLDKRTRDFAIREATSESKKLTGGRPSPGVIHSVANKGAVSALSGTIFEMATSSIRGSKRFEGGKNANAPFDFNGPTGINTMFDVGRAQFIDAKIRNSPDQKKSMFDKILKHTGTAAGGYIPNFADPITAAISREAAAGVPINQMRINQSGKLKNSNNPMGLAVTNTKDEPTGRIPNFARGKSIDPSKFMSAIDKMSSHALGVGMALSFLSGSMQSETNKLMQTMSAVIQSLSTLTFISMLSGPLQKFGSAVTMAGMNLATMPKGGAIAGGVGGMMMGAGRFLPVVGTIVAIGAALLPLISMFKKNKDAIEDEEEARKGLTKEIAGSSRTRSGAVIRQELAAATEARNRSFSAYQDTLVNGMAPMSPELYISKEDFRHSNQKRSAENQYKKNIYNPFIAAREQFTKDDMAMIELQSELARTTGQSFVPSGMTTFEFLSRFQANKAAAREARMNKNRFEGGQISQSSPFTMGPDGILQGTTSVYGFRGEFQRRVEQGSVGLTNQRKIELEFEEKLAEASQERQETQARLNQQLVESQVKIENIGDLTKEDAEAALLKLNSLTDLRDIQETIYTISGLELSNLDEQTQKLILQSQAAEQKEQSALEEAKHQKRISEELEKQNRGFEGYKKRTGKYLEDLEQDMPDRLAQNMEDAISSAMKNIANGTYDTLGEALLNVALSFGQALMDEIIAASAKSLTRNLFGGFINSVSGTVSQNFNQGGIVNGGSGVRDDVPAVLTGGEFVVRKAAVQKYGKGFFDQLNSRGVMGYNAGGVVQGADNVRTGKFFSGKKKHKKFDHSQLFGGAKSDARLATAMETDFFVPGERGFGAITGKENLLAFAMQDTTSGATDQIFSSAGGASINLEDQSARLSVFGRKRMSPARQALMASKQQAFDLAMAQASEEQRVLKENQDARRARTEAFQSAVKGAFINAAFAGASAGLQNVAAGGKFFGPKFEGGGGIAGVGGTLADGTQIKAGTAMRNIPGMTEIVPQQRSFLGINYTRNVQQLTSAGQQFYQGSQQAASFFNNPAINSFTTNGITYNNARRKANGGLYGGGDANIISSGTFDDNMKTGDMATEGSSGAALETTGESEATKTYANGGRVNSLLMGGEYVLGRGAASRLGLKTLNSINAMNYANGGSVGIGGNRESSSNANVENLEINININKDGSGEAEVGSNSGADPEKAKEFSKKVKDVVLQVINEEKRVSGTLFTRTK